MVVFRSKHGKALVRDSGTPAHFCGQTLGQPPAWRHERGFSSQGPCPVYVYERLLLGSLASIVSAAVYAFVGMRIGRRSVRPDMRGPLTAFSLWWVLLATTTGITALLGVWAAFLPLDVDVYVAFLYGGLFLLAGALGCLLYYLVFLFTGRRGAWTFLAPAYYAYAVFLVYFIRKHHPSDLQVEGWTLSIGYERPLAQDALFMVVVVLLVAPQILAALAYLSLAFRVRERTPRYRIIMVSLALLVWFASALIATSRGVSGTDAWQVTSRLIALAATVAIYWAYYPPGILRRRFGILSYGQQEARDS